MAVSVPILWLLYHQRGTQAGGRPALSSDYGRRPEVVVVVVSQEHASIQSPCTSLASCCATSLLLVVPISSHTLLPAQDYLEQPRAVTRNALRSTRAGVP